MQLLHSKVAILQALTAGPGYGLELMDRIRTASSGDIVLRQGSVYPAMDDLEAEGLLRSHHSAPLAERGGRSRRVFALTPKGRRAVERHRKALVGLLGLG